MKPLETMHRLLIWFCVCPAEEGTSELKKLIYIAFSVIGLISSIIGVVASAAYTIEFLSTDLENSLYAVFQVAAASGTFYTAIVAFIYRRRIHGIFTALEKLYRKFKNENSFRYLEEANNTSEWFWSLYCIFSTYAFAFVTLALSTFSVTFSFIKYGHFDVRFSLNPFKVILPWDQTTLIGFIEEIICTLMVAVYYLSIVGLLMMVFVAICLHHQAFYQIFRDLIWEFDEKKTNKNAFLFKLLDFHISVKDWFHESSDIYSNFILVQIICNVIYLSSIILQMDLIFHHIHFGILFLITGCSSSLAYLFLYCYFGKLATESFQNMTDCLFESNWQELPIDLQKYLILMIANMQRPLYYHGSRIAVLNLVSFTKIIKTILSYYMAFKAVTSN